MGSFFPHSENYALEEQLKILEEDELLDFWEESQFLDSYLENENNNRVKTLPAADYERLIVQELQIRASLRPIRMEPASL